MRTYSHLVRHESDFSLAQEKGLIPWNEPAKGGDNLISWDSFARLITSFDKFGDDSVSPRYAYGELRLSRLNFYSRIFLGKLTFHHINAQWGTFLNGAIAPFIVIFVVFSVILNAMQVGLAVQGIHDVQLSWAAFVNVSKWFAVLVLILATLVVGFMFSITAFFFIHDIWFAQTIVRGKKKDPHGGDWRTSKSGVV